VGVVAATAGGPRMSHDRIAALPCWIGTPSAEPLDGGLSNVSFRVTDDAGAHVVRFGTGYPFHHVDREREAMTARAGHEAGLAPTVEYTAPGVMVSAWLDARTWTAADVAAEPERTAALIRDFHARMPAHVSGPGFAFWPFHVIRDYARTLAGTRWQAHARDLLPRAGSLEQAQVPLPIVFGHHDLLPANILDDGNRLWLIDFEYAGFGTAMFDLAGAASNAQLTEPQSRALLGAYFGAPPDAALWRAFTAMEAASLMREAMWAMVSDLHLATPGVDFAAYAALNLDRLDAALTRFGALP
jgi:thiamine kinase-like enzyme